MASTPGTVTPHPKPLVADSVTIDCPPIPGGAGGGLSLQTSFKTCGTWSSSNGNAVVGCVFKPSTGGTINPTNFKKNPPPANTWSANFTINAGTTGTLHAFVKVNGVETASSDVANLQVVAAGGGTCNC
jgi:hypothetical protein